MSIPKPPDFSNEDERTVLYRLKHQIDSERDFKLTFEHQDPERKVKILRTLFEVQDNNGQTFLHHLADQKNPESAKILNYLLNEIPQDLFSSKGLYLQDKNGQTALHIAAKTANADMIFPMITYDKRNLDTLMLLQDNNKKTAFDLQDHLGRTLYHRLVRKGEQELLKFLLKEPQLHNPDPPRGVYILNTKGRTPLHIAAKTQHPEIIHDLLAFESLILTPDIKGKTPLTLGMARSALQTAMLNQTPTDPAIKLLWDATPDANRPVFQQKIKIKKQKEIPVIPASKQAEAFIRGKDNKVKTLSNKDEQIFASAEFIFHVLADRKDENGHELPEGKIVKILSDTGEVVEYVCHPIVHQHGLTGFALTPTSGVGDIKIIFRGTKDKAGAGRDLSPLAAGHDTFSRNKYAILTRINDILDKEVKRLNNEGLRKDLSVSVGGHSLGGADAQSAMTLLLEGMCVANKGQVPEKFSDRQTNNLSNIKKIRLQAFNAPGVANEVITRASHAAKQLKKLKPDTQINAYYLRVRRDPVNIFGQGHILVHGINPDIAKVTVLKFIDYHSRHLKAAHTQKHFNQTVTGREAKTLNPKIYEVMTNNIGKPQKKLNTEFSGYAESHSKVYHATKKVLQRAWNTCVLSTAKPVSNLPNVTPLMRINNVNAALHKKNIQDVTFSLGNDKRAKFSGNKENLFKAVQACGDQELVQAMYQLVVPMVNNDLEATKQMARDILALNLKNGTKVKCVIIENAQYNLNLEKLAEPPQHPTWPPTLRHQATVPAPAQHNTNLPPPTPKP